MIKLINLAISTEDMNKFENSSVKIDSFLDECKIDGVELILYDKWDRSKILPRQIKGLHLAFWPDWLDFWKGDTEKLLKRFGDYATIKEFYGAETRDGYIEYYRNELQIASLMGVEYVVCHVSHVEPIHSFNYNFTYEDTEIIDCFAEFMNEVLADLDIHFDILFENLWLPGLKLTNKENACRLLEKIKYPNKGFMLDIGHMMNTNLHLTNEEEAVNYILKMLSDLSETSSYIKGIHLNCSLSGEYVKNMLEEHKNNDDKQELKYFEVYKKACEHISNVDIHMPFIHADINKVIKFVNPKYLVYEFRTENMDMLRKYVTLQNEILVNT